MKSLTRYITESLSSKPDPYYIKLNQLDEEDQQRLINLIDKEYDGKNHIFYDDDIEEDQYQDCLKFIRFYDLYKEVWDKLQKMK